MDRMPAGDPYIENIIAGVPADVARTLTPAQVQGIREALTRSRAGANHALDVRMVIPLYFLRLYFVWIIGKDRRRRVESVLFERRSRAARVAGAAVIAIALTILALAGVSALYVLKSAANVDLMPGFHLREWLPWL